LKNKKIGILLTSLALLLGGSFVGSQALFSSTASVSPSLNITMGSLQVEAVGGWYLNDNPIGYFSYAPWYLNSLDVLSRTVTVRNSGSLAQRIYIYPSIADMNFSRPRNGIRYTATAAQIPEVLQPGQSFEISLKAVVENAYIASRYYHNLDYFSDIFIEAIQLGTTH